MLRPPLPAHLKNTWKSHMVPKHWRPWTWLSYRHQEITRCLQPISSSKVLHHTGAIGEAKLQSCSLPVGVSTKNSTCTMRSNCDPVFSYTAVSWSKGNTKCQSDFLPLQVCSSCTLGAVHTVCLLLWHHVHSLGSQLGSSFSASRFFHLFLLLSLLCPLCLLFLKPGCSLLPKRSRESM